MDYRFANAYMTERLQEAEHWRLLAELRAQRAKRSPLERIRQLVGETLPSWRPVTATSAVVSGDCMELECCAA